jgi:hypothetical protein
MGAGGMRGAMGMGMGMGDADADAEGEGGGVLLKSGTRPLA